MKFVLTACFCLAVFFAAGVNADIAQGKSAYAARGCIGCHGAGGKSVVPTYPSLKGHKGSFIRKSLTDFRSGARKDPVMNAMAAGLSDADIRNIADYFDSIK